MRTLEDIKNYEGRYADETTQYGTQHFSSSEFRKYVLKKLELGITDPNLIVKESDYRD